MNRATRDYVEYVIDFFMNHVNFLNSVDWITKEIPISCSRDLLLGYALGSIYSALVSLTPSKTLKKVSDCEMKEMEKILKHRFADILEKIDKELEKN